jgi:hypothetical protein
VPKNLQAESVQVVYANNKSPPDFLHRGKIAVQIIPNYLINYGNAKRRKTLQEQQII